jgi:hypothetical protein
MEKVDGEALEALGEGGPNHAGSRGPAGGQM